MSTESIFKVTGRSGTVSKACTARLSTVTISSEPLTSRAASGSASRAGVNPGTRSSMVDRTTPVSPNSGRTREMYSRNVGFGPMMSTPVRESCSRQVYSR